MILLSHCINYIRPMNIFTGSIQMNKHLNIMSMQQKKKYEG